MVSLKIEDLPAFTRQLFTGDTFDRFLVQEARIVTFNAFTIDGRIRAEYFPDGDYTEEYSSWKMLRPFCFSLIRGKRLPESFSIVLALPPAGAESFTRRIMPNAPEGLVRGLYLNIRYEDKVCRLVTGTSLTQFTVDRRIEHEWDSAAGGFLKKAEIGYLEE
jgi:hypothetical protein